jgi:hypothetical protein
MSRATVGRAGTLGASAIVGVTIGLVLTLSLQSAGGQAPSVPEPQPTALGGPSWGGPDALLVWVPGGLPAGLEARIETVPGVKAATTVEENVAWLDRSWAGSGGVVDAPPEPFRIPLDTASIRPRDYAGFLPATARRMVAGLDDGEAVLGSTSAALRGLGPGAVLRFAGRIEVRVVGVVPDELVGAAEVIVTRSTGRALGVRSPKYVLVGDDPFDERELTVERLRAAVRGLLPADPGRARLLQVRGPGDTPYLRAGDAVLPAVLLKASFGEFAARPVPGSPGYLEVEPGWVRDHIVTTRIPLLGRVTCNRALIPQLRGALTSLADRGLGELIRSFHGCYVARFVGRSPTAMLSHHAWGAAFDVNLAGNAVGATPHQDPRLVRLLARWGFGWGGAWVLPDGNHVEYRRMPTGEPR